MNDRDREQPEAAFTPEDDLPDFADMDAPPPTMTDAEFAAYERRENRARAAVAAKAKRIYADLLRLERFALKNGVIFMTFHEQLLASIHYFERFLWDYDVRFLTRHQPNPFAYDACGMMDDAAAHSRNVARLRYLPPMPRRERRELLAAFDLIDRTARHEYENPERADLRKLARKARGGRA